MKYKIIGMIGCAVILVASVLNYSEIFSIDTKEKRYHQHLEAQAKAPCVDHAADEFCTHLPLITINTGGTEIPGMRIIENGEHAGFTTTPDGADRITAKINVFDSETKNNHPTDTPDVSSEMTIHVRGNSSRFFDKLGYKIKLIDENGENNPQKLIGMDAHHEWALHGPYLDKTLIRNYMCYNIAGECMDYAPNVRFCELILNGEYQGVYVLTELISEGDNGARLDLDVNVKDNTYTGYLLRLDRYNSTSEDWLNSLTTYTYRNDTELKLEIEYPGITKLTDELRESIKDDFSAFEKALYSYDYNNKKYGYRNYIDTMSFVDYLLINEFTVNYDAGAYSTYIYKDLSNKFKLCVWDYNNSCDNYQEESMIQVQHFEMQNKLWFIMLTKDKDFIETVISRYRELRSNGGVLSEEYLLNYIDETIEYLGPAIDRNFEKWGYSFNDDTLLFPAERNLHSYNEAVSQLKNFIIERGRWMDDNIEALRQYSAESKVKKYNEVND